MIEHMALQTFHVYLRGGGSFALRAARFEARAGGIHFFGESDEPIPDTYVDPAEVIAVVPPNLHRQAGRFPTIPAVGE